MKESEIYDVFNIDHLKLYNTAMPRIEKLEQRDVNLADAQPDNPILICDEPDDPHTRALTQVEVQEILGANNVVAPLKIHQFINAKMFAVNYLSTTSSSPKTRGCKIMIAMHGQKRYCHDQSHTRNLGKM